MRAQSEEYARLLALGVKLTAVLETRELDSSGSTYGRGAGILIFRTCLTIDPGLVHPVL
jgi:hypothetical protein